MERLGLYDKLLMIPLFTGMGKDELEHIVAKTKFLFQKVEKDEVVVSEGDRCGCLWFQLDGTLLVETRSDDQGFVVVEEQSGCHVLQPECAFGLRQRFTHTYKALTTCNLISVDKNETQRLTTVSLIFRLNLMNVLSTHLQKEKRKAWRPVPHGLQQRIVRFLADHCQHPFGRKVFKIKMQRLADEVNDSRRNVSQCLNLMQQSGLLQLHRALIEVPALEKLC